MSSTVDLEQTVATSLKMAMRKMPSPVALVTATDPATMQPCGLAVTAYIPVSMDPPSMQICLNRSASAYGPIIESRAFAINILGLETEQVLHCFADPARRADRFSESHWQYHASLPYLPEASAAIFCSIAMTQDFGTHTMIIGQVDEVLRGNSRCPAVWLESKLCSIEAR